ncbi:type II toxin-antitoxin system RelE/ParE family toxin [Merismopedia glauca]|uniref:Type II toxin-antitoxin system mRNA interferase toxin, RelE/StbE family n=1 Tax=Merismopedia glauca CCAP 1448/3 TaxID=1296344 RepID=A0A2T1C206_9CYAN|nr:type II toxin-antitoxin system mRNA interferase toxin, RelE/StbE family [Merismopedia glauca]PSB02306.1 type II toxin-antitoxin system mRNA interferase toxin, RelE/StbE family [Merismopedia glauca CCAP 1448/3]
MRIGWNPKSIRAFKRMVRKNPQLRPLIEQALRQLAEDPFQSGLRTHKLKGDLANIWSCSIDYNYRILFEFVRGSDEEDAVLLLNIGTHDEVY